MAYKQGSMGVAILLGLLVFLGLNALFGIALYGVSIGSILAGVSVNPMAGLSLTITTCLSGFCMSDSTSLILAIILPIIAGVLSGIIARGTVGRGLIAGFSSVVIGYYIAFVMLLIYSFAVFGGLGFALNAQALVPLLSILLIVPLLLGILGGIGGALMAAIFATQVSDTGVQPSPMSTTFIQASAPPAPMIFQGGPAYQPPAPQPGASKVICPACKMQNDGVSTFCQSCGTRLKS